MIWWDTIHEKEKQDGKSLRKEKNWLRRIVGNRKERIQRMEKMEG